MTVSGSDGTHELFTRVLKMENLRHRSRFGRCGDCLRQRAKPLKVAISEMNRVSKNVTREHSRARARKGRIGCYFQETPVFSGPVSREKSEELTCGVGFRRLNQVRIRVGWWPPVRR